MMRTTLALASLSALALPTLAGHDGSAFSRRHGSQHAKRGSSQLAKRQTFSNARLSFYDVTAGETACGGFYSNSDPVVALNAEQFNNGANCGDSITITYQGTTKTATIVDECMGCGYGGLDLTENFFTEFASADAGIIYGSWVGLGGDATPTTTSTKWEEPTTTSTKKTTSSTPAYTPPATTSTHKTTSTSVYTPPPTTTHTTSTTPTTTAQPSTSATPTTSSAAPTSSAAALATAGLAAGQAVGLVNSADVTDLDGTQNIVSLYEAIFNMGYMVMV